ARRNTPATKLQERIGERREEHLPRCPTRRLRSDHHLDVTRTCIVVVKHHAGGETPFPQHPESRGGVEAAIPGDPGLDPTRNHIGLSGEDHGRPPGRGEYIASLSNILRPPTLPQQSEG